MRSLANAQYERRRPEDTVLYQIVDRHLDSYLAEANERYEAPLPCFVERTFRAYQTCGRLEEGFVRMQCEGCRREHLIALSCKRRGVCTSCGAKRMTENAAHLCESVLPHVPYRLWTFSFPRRIRWLLAKDADLLTKVLRIFTRRVMSYQRMRARRLGESGKSGTVSHIQRFGGMLNVNVHVHTTVPDGVFVGSYGGPIDFVQLPPPTPADIERLCVQIARRVVKCIQDHIPEEEFSEPGLAEAAWHGVQASLPFANDPDQTSNRNDSLSAFCEGFSLHAGVEIAAEDREGLERVLRYGARPAIAIDRVEWAQDGQVRYRFRRAAPNGATEVILRPEDFLARLAMLIPPPRRHQFVYSGVFASNHSLRSLIVLWGTEEPANLDERTRGEWSELMRRAFAIDVKVCKACGGRLRLIATILRRDVIHKILDHLKSTTDSVARAPPVAA